MSARRLRVIFDQRSLIIESVGSSGIAGGDRPHCAERRQYLPPALPNTPLFRPRDRLRVSSGDRFLPGVAEPMASRCAESAGSAGKAARSCRQPARNDRHRQPNGSCLADPNAWHLSQVFGSASHRCAELPARLRRAARYAARPPDTPSSGASDHGSTTRSSANCRKIQGRYTGPTPRSRLQTARSRTL